MKTFRTLFMMIVAVLVLGVVGGSPAKASLLWGSISFGGFSGGWTVEEIVSGQTVVNFGVSSGRHRFDSVGSFFHTLSNDPSEAVGGIYINGRRDAALNQNDSNFWSSLQIGGVSLVQSSSLRFHSGFEDFPASNSASSNLAISPFDFYGGQLFYDEYSNPENPSETMFFFNLFFYGSFGPGEEGDRLGAPFVPSPSGAATLSLLAGLMSLRRRR